MHLLWVVSTPQHAHLHKFPTSRLQSEDLDNVDSPKKKPGMTPTPRLFPMGCPASPQSQLLPLSLSQLWDSLTLLSMHISKLLRDTSHCPSGHSRIAKWRFENNQKESVKRCIVHANTDCCAYNGTFLSPLKVAKHPMQKTNTMDNKLPVNVLVM